MKIEGKPFSAFDAAKLPGGLVPAVIQDDRTLQVLMLGYMNREAYEKSLAEGRVTFYSRTRQCLWTKGETSGNRLDIVSVAADCDRDTLLIRAVPHGPTCHTGTQSCFGEAVPETEGFIRRLQAVIRQRHAAMPEGSYTARLFTRGVNKIAQKVGEEAVETVIEAVAGNREAMIYEASDLVYHLLVLLEATGCSIADLERERIFNDEVMNRMLDDATTELTVTEAMLEPGHHLRDIVLPAATLVVMVARDGTFFVPKGNSVLRVGDKLLVVTENKSEVKSVVQPQE